MEVFLRQFSILNAILFIKPTYSCMLYVVFMGKLFTLRINFPFFSIHFHFLFFLMEWVDKVLPHIHVIYDKFSIFVWTWNIHSFACFPRYLFFSTLNYYILTVSHVLYVQALYIIYRIETDLPRIHNLYIDWLLFELSEHGYQLGWNEFKYATRVYVQGYHRICRAVMNIFMKVNTMCVTSAAIFEGLSRENLVQLTRMKGLLWTSLHVYADTMICFHSILPSHQPRPPSIEIIISFF